jgi:sugar lactone lactonase YvrE
MTTTELRTIVDGLAVPECPRWHDGALWFSDQHDQQVLRHDPTTATTEPVVKVAGQPSGLGWLPDGDLLIVAMLDRTVLRWNPATGALTEYASLATVAPFHCNDMVVDADGRAYVGNFGFDFENGAAPVNTTIAAIELGGNVRVAADDIAFPNGSVITPDGATFIVAETMAARLTAFDRAPNGDLSNRRLFAQLDGAVPDGICLDAEGAVWAASPIGNVVVRVEEGGHVTDRIETGNLNAYACMLGGADRTELFLCLAPTHVSTETLQSRAGCIVATNVSVPGAGLP